jgi:hypothetical protein
VAIDGSSEKRIVEEWMVRHVPPLVTQYYEMILVGTCREVMLDGLKAADRGSDVQQDLDIVLVLVVDTNSLKHPAEQCNELLPDRLARNVIDQMLEASSLVFFGRVRRHYLQNRVEK